MYKIFLTKKVEKELDKLARTDINRILKTLPHLSDPFTTNLDIKKLAGVPGFYRLRVGTTRILFEILDNKKELWIRKIGYRGSVYRGI